VESASMSSAFDQKRLLSDPAVLRRMAIENEEVGVAGDQAVGAGGRRRWPGRGRRRPGRAG
jgi:hypothetical protein